MFIEFHGGLIERPYVQGYIIAAAFSGKLQYSLIQSASDMLAPDLFVHAKVINVEGLDIRQNIVMKMLLENAEAIA